MTYFFPTLDPSPGGFGWKANTHLRDHEYFIPIKLQQNPASRPVVNFKAMCPIHVLIHALFAYSLKGS